MHRFLPLIVFIVVLGAARLIGAQAPEDFANLQPYGALFFCGMACFGTRFLILPALVWFLTVPVTSALQGYGWSPHFLVPIIGFVLIAALGRHFRGKSGGKIFAGSLLAGLTFYLVTNTLSWAFSPGYALTPGGFIQALWTGLPGYPPTWMFFRNEMLAQVVFSGLFLLSQERLMSFRPKLLAESPIS